jgi:integrase
MLSLNVYAYVLECSQNKYYVGIAYNLKKRINSHLKVNNKASVFTKIYTPIKCIATYDLQTEDWQVGEIYENLLTIHYANLYGTTNVAGGSFCVRDDKIRSKQLIKCIERKKIKIHGEIINIKEANFFTKIKEIEIPNLNENAINKEEKEPLPFELVDDLTKDIKPKKIRLVIILSLIYHARTQRIVKLKLSSIHRNTMTISIPNKNIGEVEMPMELGLLKLLEDYYLSSDDKPTNYLFPSKSDKDRKTNVNNKIVKEFRSKLKT